MYFESLPSHAPALRIHMSDSTANILTKLGGYHIEKRGQREVKVHNRKKKYFVTNSQNMSLVGD